MKNNMHILDPVRVKLFLQNTHDYFLINVKKMAFGNHEHTTD